MFYEHCRVLIDAHHCISFFVATALRDKFYAESPFIKKGIGVCRVIERENLYNDVIMTYKFRNSAA